MNSRTRRLRGSHRKATLEAYETPCIVCQAPHSVPAHWPRHRGLGGGHAGWDRDEWCPLCPTCHDKLDGRNGTSPTCWKETVYVRAIVAAKTGRPENRAERHPGGDDSAREGNHLSDGVETLRGEVRKTTA
jgi:hypothetical protein